jgi:hypothetical protein
MKKLAVIMAILTCATMAMAFNKMALCEEATYEG